MRLLKMILISSVLLMLAAAPAYAGHRYNHPEQPDVISPEVISPEVISPEVISPEVISPEVISPEVITPDVVKGLVIRRVPPNAPKPPGNTTLAQVTEIPPAGILGTITDGPQADASVLPFTGAELTGITLLGVTAIGLGMVLSRARRRSS